MGGINPRTACSRLALLAACALTGGIGIGAQGSAIDIAGRYIEQNRQALGLTDSDTGEMVVYDLRRRA